MEYDTIKEIIEKLVPKSEYTTEIKRLNLIYKLLRQRHELTQVCLEMYKGLREAGKMRLIEYHWESELERVLFESDIFLYCTRDLPKDYEEEE